MTESSWDLNILARLERHSLTHNYLVASFLAGIQRPYVLEKWIIVFWYHYKILQFLHINLSSYFSLRMLWYLFHTQKTILSLDLGSATKMEKLYTVSKNKTGSWLWLGSWTPYCQIQTELKKVEKTSRPFRYDLNQIPYEYTLEVRNRFKVLDLIEYLMNYGWRFVTLYRRQESRPSPKKKEMQKSKMAVWGGLTNRYEKKRSKKQRRKGKI